MKTAEEFIKGCEHDGSYIPVSEVLRLMESYVREYTNGFLDELISIKNYMDNINAIYGYGQISDLIENIQKELNNNPSTQER